VSYYRVVQVKTNAKLTFPLPQQLNTIKMDRVEAGGDACSCGSWDPVEGTSSAPPKHQEVSIRLNDASQKENSPSPLRCSSLSSISIRGESIGDIPAAPGEEICRGTEAPTPS